MSNMSGDHLHPIVSLNNNNNNNNNSNDGAKKQGNHKNHLNRGAMMMGGGDLWTDGLVCAFEYVWVPRKPIPPKSGSKFQQGIPVMPEMLRVHSECANLTEGLLGDSSPARGSAAVPDNNEMPRSHLHHRHTQPNCSSHFNGDDSFPRSYWVPIGWDRISQLVQMLQVDATWTSQLLLDFPDDQDEVTVADMAAPYWECPEGLTWWCHVDAGHPHIKAWLSHAQWLHPAISIALRDESQLISERMKYVLYEVPVVVAGGLLFELLGHSAVDPYVDEDDIPIVLRSWHSQNFLITALHVKGSSSNVNVLGIAEVQELLAAGGTNVPRSIHEVIAHLACRLARWDDRLFRKSIFGVADEVELKFMNRRMHEDMHLFSVILNQEIRRLSTQVIRVKWSLHAREEIVFELLQHLRGNAARSLLEGIRKSTREMIEEQEAVRGRLFTIQDVMQSTVRAWLQDRSLRVTHNLGVFGGCGLVLSIITGLFGINVDGIPGAEDSPYAFALFSGILCLLGVVLIATGLLYLGWKKPIDVEDVEVRKLELQELVRLFKLEAESHAQVRKTVSRMPDPPTTPTARSLLSDEEGYVLVG